MVNEDSLSFTIEMSLSIRDGEEVWEFEEDEEELLEYYSRSSSPLIEVLDLLERFECNLSSFISLRFMILY